MAVAILLPSATADLEAIWEFIAEDNPGRARQLIERIIHTCDTTLAENPYIGRSRDQLYPELRSFPFQNYTIFYLPIDDGVEIFHVYEGHRDVDGVPSRNGKNRTLSGSQEVVVGVQVEHPSYLRTGVLLFPNGLANPTRLRDNAYDPEGASASQWSSGSGPIHRWTIRTGCLKRPYPRLQLTLLSSHASR